MAIRILVVDNKAPVLAFLQEALGGSEAFGELILTESASEALHLAAAGPVDLLITDPRMTGDMDGITLTQALRAQYPALRVLWLAADEGCTATAQRLNVETSLHGPLDAEALRAAVQETLRPRLLLVEDQLDEQRLYTRALQKHGYTVLGVTTTREARTLLLSQHFALVLCDIHLEDATAVELLREFTPRLQRARTPLIIISGDDRYRDECEALGIDFYVEKPLNMTSLITLIERLLLQTQAA